MKKRRINRKIGAHAGLDHDTFVRFLQDWWGITFDVSIRVYEEPFLVPTPKQQGGCPGCEHCQLETNRESLVYDDWTVPSLPDPDILLEGHYTWLWANARTERDKTVKEILAFEAEATKLYLESPDT